MPSTPADPRRRPAPPPASAVATQHEMESLAVRLDALAGAYSFMSRVLLAPVDRALLDRLAAPGLLDEWPLGPEADTTRGLHLLALSLGQETSAPESLETLMRDYADLFVGPGPLLAPPYESVHLTTDRLLFDEPTMQVRAAYRAFDLVAPHLNREPDDHIGLELHFLTELCARALDAIETGDDFVLDTTLAAHQGFLTDHVLRWAPDLFDLVAAYAATSFYQGVAALGAATLRQARNDLAL